MSQRPRGSANRAALAGLRAASSAVTGLGSPPGAASTRLHGRYASATVGSVSLHLFEWELTWEMEVFDATAHGERWKVWVPGDQQWTLRARGYFVRSTATYLQAAASTTADPSAVAVACYQDLSTDAAARVWAGNGFIVRGNFSVPMAMLMQEMEIRGTGVPSDIAI